MLSELSPLAMQLSQGLLAAQNWSRINQSPCGKQQLIYYLAPMGECEWSEPLMTLLPLFLRL